jgi:hypothetical protein
MDAFYSKDLPMSKRSRHADNSKRQQPVQQQRAQAAQQTGSAKKTAGRTDKQQGERSADASKR